MNDEKKKLTLKFSIMAIVFILGCVLPAIVAICYNFEEDFYWAYGCYCLLTCVIEAFFIEFFFSYRIKDDSKVLLIVQESEEKEDVDDGISEIIDNLKIYNSAFENFENNNF